MSFIRRQTFLATVLVVCISSLAFAKSLPKSQSDLLRDLPKDLSKLHWNWDQKKVEAFLGKPGHQTSDENHIFVSYSLAGGLYDTTFTFVKGKLQSMSYIFPKQKWVAADMQDIVTTEEMKQGEAHPIKNSPHVSGEEFSAVSIKNGVSATIAKDKIFSVKRLLFWKPGEPKP